MHAPANARRAFVLAPFPFLPPGNKSASCIRTLACMSSLLSVFSSLKDFFLCGDPDGGQTRIGIYFDVVSVLVDCACISSGDKLAEGGDDDARWDRREQRHGERMSWEWTAIMMATRSLVETRTGWIRKVNVDPRLRLGSISFHDEPLYRRPPCRPQRHTFNPANHSTSSCAPSGRGKSMLPSRRRPITDIHLSPSPGLKR